MTSTVAEIVAADIRSMPCECDVYPSFGSLEVTALHDAVPETLHRWNNISSQSCPKV